MDLYAINNFACRCPTCSRPCPGQQSDSGAPAGDWHDCRDASDADVLAFRFGVPYAHQLAHRGITHSLVFALLLAMLAWIFAKQLASSREHVFSFVFFATASHALLDMPTNGGLGLALIWPVSGERLFFPLRVIEVSPLDIRRFFSSTGVRVLLSELQWAWIPSTIAAVSIVVWRKIFHSSEFRIFLERSE